MDLIAIYNLLFITITSFLGLITAVLVGFGCNKAFFFPKEPKNFVKEGLFFTKEEINFMKEETDFMKEGVNFTKEGQDFMKEQLNFMKKEINFTKEEQDFTKENHISRIKPVIMACNYGDRLAVPIVD